MDGTAIHNQTSVVDSEDPHMRSCHRAFVRVKENGHKVRTDTFTVV